MKRLKLFFTLTLTLLICSSVGVYAQGRFGKDSAQCVNYLNFYRDYYKQGNYKEAAPLWKNAIKYCPPQASQNLFIDGRKIVQYLIQQAKANPGLRKQMVDTLMMLHDIRSQYFPKYRVAVAENRAFDMLSFFDADNTEVFAAIEKVIELSGNKTKPALLVAYMSKAKDLYQRGIIPDEQVLKAYTDLSPIMEAKVAAEQTEDVKVAAQAFDNEFITSGVANCDNLVKVFTPRYEENSNNIDVVKPIVKLLSDNECIETDLFLHTVTAMHNLEPSYNSSFFLYRLHNSKDNNDEAIKFLQEAIDSPESDDAKDGELLLEMATYYYKKLNSPAKAVQSARAAIEKNPAVAGKANFLIGNIWANTKCSGNEIDVRAKYWVCVDYFSKAKSQDPEVAEEADKLIAQYRQYYPKTEDAFMYDLTDGKSYTISCGGLSATTTVRTIK